MSTFQNTTSHAINVLVNGSRRSIKPGQLINGPDNLNAIPGLTCIEKSKSTIIPKINKKMLEPTPYQPTPITPTFSNNGNSHISQEVDAELQYVRKMFSLGRNPSVTIAILTKNSLKLISDCCESIFHHVRYKNLTLLIADTGTNEIEVRNYYSTLLAKCIVRGWNYKYVQLPGFHYSSNYNRTIDQIDTEYVLIQNNDTVALNDYVTEMMGTAVLRRVGSTGCRMFYPDRVSIQHDGQTLFNAPNLMWGGPGHVHLRVHKDSIPPSYTDIVDGNTAAGALMRVSDYKSIGGFDEKYKDIFQDVDLMIKIPQMLNKYNYCNKQANIIHIDNASRLATGHDPKRHAAMWEDTNYMKHRITSNGWMKGKRPNSVDFSIITLVYNLKDYEDLCLSLKSQVGSHSVEIIAIPNFFNQFTSVFKALNTAADTANGKTLIFCHDDIVVPPDWLTRIRSHVNNLDNQKIPWGVIGPAGVFENKNQSAFFLTDSRGNQLWKTQPHILHEQTRYEVSSLDELCLITKKSNNLRFSDNHLTGFHFYGVNICSEAKLKNLKVFAIDSYCYHKSDGYKNISSPEKYQIYEEQAKSFNLWAKTHGINNWRSTTAMGNNNVITLFTKKPS